MHITQAMRDDYDSASAYDENEKMNNIYYDFKDRIESVDFSACLFSEKQVDGEYQELANEAMALKCDHLKFEILTILDNKLMTYVPMKPLGTLYEKVKGLVDLK